MSDWTPEPTLYRRTPTVEKLRMLRVFGMLALLAAASELLLVIFIGPRPLEGNIVHGVLLRWFALWWTAGGLSILIAAMARNWFERPPHSYPGMKTGIAVTVFYTAMFLFSP
jgi:hypothetical protein